MCVFYPNLWWVLKDNSSKIQWTSCPRHLIMKTAMLEQWNSLSFPLLRNLVLLFNAYYLLEKLGSRKMGIFYLRALPEIQYLLEWESLQSKKRARFLLSSMIFSPFRDLSLFCPSVFSSTPHLIRDHNIILRTIIRKDSNRFSRAEKPFERARFYSRWKNARPRSGSAGRASVCTSKKILLWFRYNFS